MEKTYEVNKPRDIGRGQRRKHKTWLDVGKGHRERTNEGI